MTRGPTPAEGPAADSGLLYSLVGAGMLASSDAMLLSTSASLPDGCCLDACLCCARS